MKTLYGIIELLGFIIIIGGAGGADRTPFSTVVLMFVLGFGLIGLSCVLIKMHNAKIKKLRRIRTALRPCVVVQSVNQTATQKAHTKIKPGIRDIIKNNGHIGERNSLKVC